MTSQAATTMTMMRHDLAVAVAVHAAERDEREVRRVEHQLEAEQDHQRVALDEHAAGADAEDERRDDEVPGDAHQPPLPVAPGADARSCRRLGVRHVLGDAADALAHRAGARPGGAASTTL